MLHLLNQVSASVVRLAAFPTRARTLAAPPPSLLASASLSSAVIASVAIHAASLTPTMELVRFYCYCHYFYYC